MKYYQVINFIELTKLLERETVDTLCFTYPLDKNYNFANIAAEVEEYFPVVAEGVNYVMFDSNNLGYVSIQTKDNNCVLYAANAYTTFGYSIETTLSLTNLETGKKVYEITLRLDENNEPTNKYGVEIAKCKLPDYGVYEIKYEFPMPSTQAKGHVSYIFNCVANSINNSPSVKLLSITDVINRVLDVGLGRKQNETHKYKLDPKIADEYSKIAAPEYMFTRNTLYEVLLQIGGTSTVNAIPKLIWNEEEDKPNIITFTKLGGSEEYELPENSVIAYQDMTDPEEYCSELDSYVDNMVYSASPRGGTITEPADGQTAPLYKTTRCEQGEIAIYDDTAIITTEYPIYRVISLKQGFVNNEETVVGDITPYVFEQSEYDTLSSYKGTFPNVKMYALTYKQGDNRISGLSFKATVRNDTEEALTDYAAKNIATRQGKIKPSSSSWPLANFAYQITYIPIISTRIKQRKPNLKFGQGNTLFYNQSANTVEASSYGNSLKYNLAKIGNQVEIYTFRVKGESEVPKAGLLYDAKYIAQVDCEYNLNNVKVSMWVTPDYNRLSNYVGINSSKRFYEVSERQSVERYINVSENIYVGDDEKTDETPSPPKHTSLTTEGIASFIGTLNGNNAASVSNVIAQSVGREIIVDKEAQAPPSERTFNIGEKTLHAVMAIGMGNSLAFSWKYRDNYSAGEQALYGGASKKYQRSVPYGDYYGRLYYLEMSLGSRLNHDATFDKQTTTINEQRFCDKLPVTNDKFEKELISFNCTNGNAIVADKDSREALNICVQEHLIANRDGIVFGSRLTQYNGLVKNCTEATPAKGLYLLPNKINMLCDVIDTDNAMLITPFPDVGYNDRMAKIFLSGLKMDIGDKSYKAWAIVDSDTRNLYIGENIQIDENNNKLKDVIFNF